MRKLSRPWHGPYHITKINGQNVSALKVYHPQKEGITVHQSRAKHYPINFQQAFTGMAAKVKDPEGHPGGLNNFWLGNKLTR